MAARQLEYVLVRLELRTDRVVEERRSRLLDVRAEDVSDAKIAREVDQPPRALRERGRVSDVEAARVHGVAGQQDPSPPVVNGDRCAFVSGNRYDVEHAP